MFHVPGLKAQLIWSQSHPSQSLYPWMMGLGVQSREGTSTQEETGNDRKRLDGDSMRQSVSWLNTLVKKREWWGWGGDREDKTELFLEIGSHVTTTIFVAIKYIEIKK